MGFYEAEPREWSTSHSGVTEQDLLFAARRTLLQELRAPHSSPLSRRAAFVEPEADRQTLVAFFTVKDPSKLPLIDEILEKFKGKEPTMYEFLITQYGISRANKHRNEIVKYYERHNPTRICAVDLILDIYDGHEDQLMFLLVNKYQPNSPLKVWCRYLDTQSGRQYFHNRITQEVQWEVPTEGFLVDPTKAMLHAVSRPLTPVSVLPSHPPAHVTTPTPTTLHSRSASPAWQPPAAITACAQAISPPRSSPEKNVKIRLPSNEPRKPTRPARGRRDSFDYGTPLRSHEVPLHPKQPHPTKSIGAMGADYAGADEDGQSMDVLSVSSSAADAASEPCVCEVCHVVCQGFEDLAQHKERAKHGSWHQCGVDDCPFRFPSQHSLLLHTLQIHQTSPARQKTTSSYSTLTS
ncbi:hypothetical protein DIPPA_35910 [Diplonema papillatum]|nr:hypothetical protein DIPPA_35910 [Diplonema papillatum]